MKYLAFVILAVSLPFSASAFQIIEHQSDRYALLEDLPVPGTDHTALELLGDQNIPPEVHSFELIRETGDFTVDAAWKLNQFYFADGDAFHDHSHNCMHHSNAHSRCTDQVEFCWTEWERRCSYEYVCRWYDGRRICDYQYICRDYPTRRCIWKDVPVEYFEYHGHHGNLPFYGSQSVIPVTIYFPSNAPLTGNRTESFTLNFDGNKASIKFDRTSYLYSVEDIVVAPNRVTITLSAVSRELLSDPDQVKLELNRDGGGWAWITSDNAFGMGDVATSYHLKIESCFLVFCDKPVDHWSWKPFELSSVPLKDNTTWSITLDVERSGASLGNRIKFLHKYQYKDGVFGEM